MLVSRSPSASHRPEPGRDAQRRDEQKARGSIAGWKVVAEPRQQHEPHRWREQRNQERVDPVRARHRIVAVVVATEECERALVLRNRCTARYQRDGWRISGIPTHLAPDEA